ncbi:MAG: hypothetical protein BZ133_01025 [Methanosphaera sp. SHI613]|jgi:hypothetical protein|nr:MAG: hypothetical protein BZ133_01025 [Methanosphaera sp. SHI613]
MKYAFILLVILYLLTWFIGPAITNKLGVSKKIYLNKSFTRLKAKYLGYLLIAFTILMLILDYNSLNGVDFYYMMVSIVGLILFAIILILRNDYLNMKYTSNKNGDKYYLDFVNVAIVPLIIIALLTSLLTIDNNMLLIIIMIVIFIELIITVFALCPDKIHEYFISKKYSFSHKQYIMIIVVLSLIPVSILGILIMILSYII